LRKKKERNKRYIENGNNNNNNIRAHYTKQSVYTHTHKKWPKRINVDARIKYLQLFCVTQYFSFSLYVYTWEQKEEKHGRKFSIRHKKKQKKCLEKITNLNTQVKTS